MKLHRIVHDRVHHGNNNLIILTNCARLLKHIPQKKHKQSCQVHAQKTSKKRNIHQKNT